jgi:probable phosphoglycerate mutase
MELLLIRHALPVRVEGAEGTAADPDLSDLGHEQAKALAAWLADEHRRSLHEPAAARAANRGPRRRRDRPRAHRR